MFGCSGFLRVHDLAMGGSSHHRYWCLPAFGKTRNAVVCSQDSSCGELLNGFQSLSFLSDRFGICPSPTDGKPVASSDPSSKHDHRSYSVRGNMKDLNTLNWKTTSWDSRTAATWHFSTSIPTACLPSVRATTRVVPPLQNGFAKVGRGLATGPVRRSRGASKSHRGSLAGWSW